MTTENAAAHGSLTIEPKPDAPAVGRFYDSNGGWRMFQPTLRTAAVINYLGEEAAWLAKFLCGNRTYNHLVEVGCGQGTYADLAMDSGVHYDGFDLVERFVRQGDQRVKRLSNPLRIHLALHHISIDQLDKVKCRLAPKRKRSVVLFPFNCFGNLVDIRAAIKAIKSIEADIILSNFGDTDTATEERVAYYARCGYRHLGVESPAEGVLITSSEGLHSFAYHDDFLIRTLAESGYRYVQSSKLDKIGSLIRFEGQSGS